MEMNLGAMADQQEAKARCLRDLVKFEEAAEGYAAPWDSLSEYLKEFAHDMRENSNDGSYLSSEAIQVAIRTAAKSAGVEMKLTEKLGRTVSYLIVRLFRYPEKTMDGGEIEFLIGYLDRIMPLVGTSYDQSKTPHVAMIEMLAAMPAQSADSISPPPAPVGWQAVAHAAGEGLRGPENLHAGN